MIHLTDHAVDRYVDRVKPYLTFHDAKAEIFKLLRDFAVISTEPPTWWYDSGEHEEPFSGFAMIGDTIAFGLRGNRAITCFVPASLGETARAARNAARRGRQRTRHATSAKWKEHKASRHAAAGRGPRRKDWSDAAA